MSTISDTAVDSLPRLALLPVDPATPLSVRQAAIVLGVSVGSVYAMVDDGSLPHFRIGPKKSSIRFKRQDLDGYMASCYVPAASSAPKPVRSGSTTSSVSTTYTPKHLKPKSRLKKK